MTIERKTHTIDASNKILGRLASRVANLLIGKVKRDYTPNIDAGDIVIIKNVEKMRFSGQKVVQKEHKWYSGYPGGLKRTKLGKMIVENPQKVLRLAVSRMLPKNRLQPERIKRLRFE